MLLALDVGNTNITAGIFNGARLVRRRRLITDPSCSAGSLGREFERFLEGRKGKIRAAVYGSVVPALNRTLEAAVSRRFGLRPVPVTPFSPLGIRIRVRRPQEVGADRILNALAAFESTGRACVVVDFGTATTFDCVSKHGDYLGGAILPGPKMSAEALASRTAQLPLVEIKRPERVIGRDTAECIRAGLYFGYLGMIEKVLGLTLREMKSGGNGSCRILATGGLARLFKKDLPSGVSLEPDLTLQGLRIAYHRLKQNI